MVNSLFTTYKCTFTFQVFFVKCHSVENRGIYETISYKADQRLYHYVTIVERHRMRPNKQKSKFTNVQMAVSLIWTYTMNETGI